MKVIIHQWNNKPSWVSISIGAPRHQKIQIFCRPTRDYPHLASIRTESSANLIKFWVCNGDLSILYKKYKWKVAEETIEFLLEEYKDREGFLSMLDDYGRDIFTHIISNEAEETALKALYAIDDVNREDQYGYSYLTFAGVGHKVKVIEELLRM